MPYITEGQRRRFHDLLGALPPGGITPGELNYLCTQLAIHYVEGRGLNYQAINDVLGAFEGAKTEFYRRVAAPYEDRKIAENGDVYPKEGK